MANDLTLTLDNLPGELARVGEVLGNAGVNIDGFAGLTSGDKGEIHLLVEDAAAARSALEEAGIIVVTGREVIVVACDDRPGELGRITRRIGEAGVNINLAYLATGTRLVIGADDLDKARAAL